MPAKPKATTAAKRLAVLIVTDPSSERSNDPHALAQALADAGSLVLGVRAGDATLPEAVAQLKPDVVVARSDSGVRGTSRERVQSVIDVAAERFAADEALRAELMMTSGPAATIGEIVSVPLARPRERVALAEDPTYVHCRKEGLEFLYTRHGHPQKEAA